MHYFFTLLTCLITLNFLEAMEPPTFLDLSGGYRWDEIRSEIKSYNPDGTFIGYDKLKATDLGIYLIGAKGQVNFCNWFLRGFAYEGLGKRGSYHERGVAFDDFTIITHAHVHRIKTYDTQIGLGYLFSDGCYFETWGVAPVVGWSFNAQKLRMHSAFTDGNPDPILQGLKYETRWNGPWIGLDGMYCYFDDLILQGGFEYHWAHWHGAWDLSGPDVLDIAFSDHRHSNRACGYVLYLDGKMNLYEGWLVGVGVKWQRWQANQGSEKPVSDFETVGIPDVDFDKVKRASWHTLAIYFDIGYLF